MTQEFQTPTNFPNFQPLKLSRGFPQELHLNAVALDLHQSMEQTHSHPLPQMLWGMGRMSLRSCSAASCHQKFARRLNGKIGFFVEGLHQRASSSLIQAFYKPNFRLFFFFGKFLQTCEEKCRGSWVCISGLVGLSASHTSAAFWYCAKKRRKFVAINSISNNSILNKW